MKAALMVSLLSLFMLNPHQMIVTEPAAKASVQIENIKLSLPPDVKVSQTCPVEDFVIVSFEYDGNQFLKAYIGNAPSFPLDEEDDKFVKETKINNLDAKMMESVDGDGNYNKDILISLSEDFTWPKYLHMFYRGNSDKLAMLAEQIINSVEIVKAGK